MNRYIMKLVSNNKASILLFIIYISLALVSSCLSFIQPYFNGLFIDVLISAKGVTEVIHFALFVALLGICAAVINYLVGTFAVKLCGRYSFELLYAITDNYLEGSYLAQKKDNPVYVTQRLYSDCNTICLYFFNNVINIPVILLVIISIMIVLLSLSPSIFFMALLLSVIYFLVIYSYKKLIFRAQLEKKEYESKFVAKIAEVFSSFLEIKLLSINKLALNNLRSQFNLYYPKYVKTGTTTVAFGSSDTVVSTVFQSFVLILSGIMILNHDLSVGQYVIICAYFNVLLSSYKKLITVIQSKQEANASWNRIQQLNKAEENKNTKILKSISIIEVKNLQFRFYNMEKDLLNIHYLQFLIGETYCISGVNGAGKTTLCYILLGLYESNDSIFYDGISIGQLNVSETRKRNIYIVPQKPYVPDTLVEFYLRDRLQQTNKYNLSDLHRLSVERHVPLNLYNEVCAHFDENCRNLSGGEFKKLNLFIGLLSSASILILDEPTNDLDQESIILIRNYVRNNPLNKMIIIVTHEKELEAACSHSVLLS